MVHILLTVLKIIGILLAVIFLLLLFFVLVFLFGPICYRAKGQYEEERFLKVSVSWLGVVLRCHAYWQEEKLRWQVRAFGFLIASNDPKVKKKREKKYRKKNEEKDRKTAKAEEKLLLEEEKTFEEESHQMEAEFSDPMDRASVEESSVDNFSFEERKDQEKETEIPEKMPDLSGEEEQKMEESPENGNSILEEMEKRFRSFQKRIHNRIAQIKAIPHKIKKKIQSIRAGIHRIEEYREFFFGERNRPAFTHIWQNLKKMFCHILPVKLKGDVTFGLEDPYRMGQLLTVLAIFYPLYEDKFTLHPDFEQPGFSGHFFFRGRVIPGYLLFRILVILSRKDVRRVLKEGSKQIGG